MSNIENEFLENSENNATETQPEETFDEYLISVINEVKNKLNGDYDILMLVKSNKTNTKPVVLLNGHPYDVASMGLDFLRNLKQDLISQLEC